MDIKLIELELKAPFRADDVGWRVQQSGMKGEKPWASVLAYIDNRAIMDRLDDVVGPANWQNSFCEIKDGFKCGIGIWLEPLGQRGEWIWKWDGAGVTNIETVKGGISDAMKRAGYQWGIGRYLYNLPAGWATFEEKGIYSAKIADKLYRWNPPALSAWALPAKETDFGAYLKQVKALKDELLAQESIVGEAIYYRLLRSMPGNPVHANEIKNPSVQREFYRMLKGLVGAGKNEA